MQPPHPPGERERHAGARALPVPGDVIAGKYAIVKVIGEGGMGVVFEATHLKLRQRVAVKMLLPEMLAHEIIVTRFEREARASGQLRNRHAVRVMDVDVTAEGLPYMVMEFLEGHDLQVELDRRNRLPCGEAVDIVLQACSAMIAAHQIGIIHRDLKPANLFLAHESDADDARIVKVLDFGISKVQADGDEKLTVADSVIGTAMYMSPEQLRSSNNVDARADIWSLGIILFELLSGRPPWIGSPTQLAAAVVVEDAPDVRTLVPDLPADIAVIVATALRRDPNQRFGDVKQLALALAPFAPPTGVGRLLAESLLHSSSGRFPRVSIRPAPLEEARTIVQAAAVSESRMGGTGPGGTAPGWSQHSAPPLRHRTVLVGFLIAFAIGLVLVGGSALALLRWKASSASDRAAAAHASASASPKGNIASAAPPVVSATPPTAIAASPSPAESATASGGSTPSTATPGTTAAAGPGAPLHKTPGTAPAIAAPRAPVAPQAPAAPQPPVTPVAPVAPAAPPPVAPHAPAPPAAPQVKPATAPTANPLLL